MKSADVDDDDDDKNSLEDILLSLLILHSTSSRIRETNSEPVIRRKAAPSIPSSCDTTKTLVVTCTWSAKISRRIQHHLAIGSPKLEAISAIANSEPRGIPSRPSRPSPPPPPPLRRHKPIGRRRRCQPSGRDPCQNGKGRVDGRMERRSRSGSAAAVASSGIWDMRKSEAMLNATRSASAQVTQLRRWLSDVISGHRRVDWSG